jgi:hypothetical protein
VVLSKREKYIAIGLGATLGLVVLNWAVIGPLGDWGEQIAAQTRVAEGEASAERTLFNRERRDKKIWAEIMKGGLKDDPSEADSQLQYAIADWTRASGMTDLSIRPERQVTSNGFVEIALLASGTGSTVTVGKLLRQMETAPIPVRIEDLQISSRNDGTDDLKVQLKLSTLSIASDSKKPRKPATRPAATVAQSSGGSL